MHRPRRDAVPWKLLLVWLCLGWLALPTSGLAETSYPDIVLITVDTLRSDRLGSYGYGKDTSPNIDALMADGVRFTEARVPEPLTAPSMCSMITSLDPHEHGTSRNGLRMRPDLMSLPKILQRRRYATAAFIANWTLKDEISGLAEHFDDYHEIFTRKRWYVFAGEATAEDVSEEALDWIEEHLEAEKRRPFFVWVHVVEPHAPYRFQREFAERLGLDGSPNASERYDTEIAFVDAVIGDFLKEVKKQTGGREPLVVFASDHGESLGEHGYWGHGRNLHEPSLHIPMSITWKGRLEKTTVDAPASILDIAPTLFGLLDLPVYSGFRGVDWAPILAGEQPADRGRVTLHQAHKGAVQRTGNTSARRQGLLEVARVENGRKEILRVTNGKHWIFDLKTDAAEVKNLSEGAPTPSEALAAWLSDVRAGLEASDDLPPPSLDKESIEQLKALGYID